MLASATITTATSVNAMPARKHTEVCLTAPNGHFYSLSESMLRRRTGYMLCNASLHYK